jgi:hypothetical protein
MWKLVISLNKYGMSLLVGVSISGKTGINDE